MPLAPEAASRPFSPDLRLTPAQDRPVPLGEPAQAPVSLPPRCLPVVPLPPVPPLPAFLIAVPAATILLTSWPLTSLAALLPQSCPHLPQPLARCALGLPILPCGCAHSGGCLSPPLLPSQPSPSPTLIRSVILGPGTSEPLTLLLCTPPSPKWFSLSLDSALSPTQDSVTFPSSFSLPLLHPSFALPTLALSHHLTHVLFPCPRHSWVLQVCLRSPSPGSLLPFSRARTCQAFSPALRHP